ncbi:hypothetical protein, partial [Amycolatopsis japonica]|uniref:hypothetical protein n=1 Tax=Amycolatopsis japonica TaxID=208439 RepID=UPI0033D09022
MKEAFTDLVITTFTPDAPTATTAARAASNHASHVPDHASHAFTHAACVPIFPDFAFRGLDLTRESGASRGFPQAVRQIRGG